METEYLKILHDHYKESFSYIAQREKNRNFLYIVMLVLFMVLALEIYFPVETFETVDEVKIFDVKLNLSTMPFAVWLNGTWVFVLMILMRYFQDCTTIERQYTYLHKLEEVISASFDKTTYNREGYAYLDQYPLFKQWIWIFHSFLIPIVLLLFTIFLFVIEVGTLKYPWFHKLFDGLMATGIVISIVLYKYRQLFPIMSPATEKSKSY